MENQNIKKAYFAAGCFWGGGLFNSSKTLYLGNS